MERVALYARVSTEEQAERSTIDSQLDACRRYCAVRDWTVAQEFTDEGISGTTPLDERPAGAALLAALADKAFDRVVIYAVDRLSRASMDVAAADYNRLFSATRSRDGDERLHFVALDLPTSTPEGEVTLGILQVFARYERRSIARRTTAGRRRKAKEGYVASITPYGYAPVRATKTTAPALVVNEEQAEVVREVYRLAIEENLGLNAIAQRLNERGQPPPNNARHPRHLSTHGWHASTIQRILTAQRYCGRGVYAGEPTVSPPIVSEELFQAAREATQRRKRVRSARTPDDQFILRGVARCRLCGGACSTGHVGRGRLAYYRCTKALRYGFAAHGGRGQWPASRVEPPVQRWVLALLDDPDAALAQAQVYWEKQDAAWKERPERKRQLEAKLKALVVEEESAVTLQVKGRIDEDALERQLARIRSERAATLGELLKSEEDTTARARQLVDRAVVQGAIDLMRSSPTNPYADMLDDLMLATSTSAEDRQRWQADVRRVVQTAWLEQDGSVTVEGLLPGAVTASPPSSPRGFRIDYLSRLAV